MQVALYAVGAVTTCLAVLVGILLAILGVLFLLGQVYPPGAARIAFVGIPVGLGLWLGGRLLMMRAFSPRKAMEN
ncbi:MAG: hypothetical protein IR159_12205 [Brevundimonas sp.]|nr:hypothetical protein [Brevundimonas sp.]